MKPLHQLLIFFMLHVIYLPTESTFFSIIPQLQNNFKIFPYNNPFSFLHIKKTNINHLGLKGYY